MKTRALTEGAMSAVIIVLLSCFDFASGLLSPLIPIPLAVIVYRHYVKTGMAVAFVSAAAVALITASPLTGVDVIITGLLGIALGLAVKERFSVTRIFIIGVGASVLAAVLRIFTFSLITGYSFIEDYTLQWERISQYWLEVWQSGSLPVETAEQLKAVAASMPDLARMLLPMAVVGYSILETIVCLFGLKVALKRLGALLPPMPRFIHWRLPWYFVWGFILSKAAAIILTYYPSEILKILVLNVDLFFSGAFFIQGLAIMWFYMTQANISKALRVLLTAVVFLTASIYVSFILIMLGVLDTWFDIRNLNKTGKGGY